MWRLKNLYKKKKKQYWDEKLKSKPDGLAFFVLYLLTLGVCFLASTWFMTWEHEQAHKAIFESFGVSGEVQINYLLGDGKTIPDSEQYWNLTDDQRMLVSALNEANEIYGYQIFAINVAIFIIAGLIGIGFLIVIETIKWQISHLKEVTKSDTDGETDNNK